MAEDRVAHELLERSVEIAGEQERVSVGDVIDGFGARGFGPLLAVGGLLAVVLTPIPATSVIFGLILALLGAQHVIRGDRAPWLPERLRAMRVSSARLQRMVGRIDPWVSRIDVLFRPRATTLAADGLARVWAGVVTALAISMIPFSIVPGGAIPSALLIAIMGLAIAARDGVVLTVAGSVGAVVILVATGILP